MMVELEIYQSQYTSRRGKTNKKGVSLNRDTFFNVQNYLIKTST